MVRKSLRDTAAYSSMGNLLVQTDRAWRGVQVQGKEVARTWEGLPVHTLGPLVQPGSDQLYEAAVQAASP